MAYDANDNRSLRQDSQGGTITYVCDALNRLTSEQFGGSGQTPLRLDLTYTAQDEIASEIRCKNLAGTQSVGTSTFAYDATGDMTNLLPPHPRLQKIWDCDSCRKRASPCQTPRLCIDVP
jgi:hypothetical protein